MSPTTTGFIKRLWVTAAFTAVWALAASGCAVNQPIQTQRYRINAQDFWEVKKVAKADGEDTHVVIGQFGDAMIDDGSGTAAPSSVNYDTRTADVHVHVYAWPDPGTATAPVDDVSQRLMGVAELALPAHLVVPALPNECRKLPRKFRNQGETLTSIDLVKRPGWRTTVVGLRGKGNLVGVVARVEFEQDPLRYCHNLNNMRTQLQNLLDGFELHAPTAAPATESTAVAPEAPVPQPAAEQPAEAAPGSTEAAPAPADGEAISPQ